MTPIGVTGSCDPAPGQTPPYQPGTNVTSVNTFTYDDQCFNDASGTAVAYYNTNSTVTGYGQCQSLGYNPGLSWAICPAINNPVEIDGATATDYNRMYNYAYDTYWATTKPIAGGCQPTGTGRYDMKQCPGKTCNCVNKGGSPILIDVAGEGFHLTSEEKGVQFDILADGLIIQTSWTDPHFHNSFLVHDVPSNGKLTGKNLFGNHTYPDCNNGYCALAKFAQVDPAKGGVVDEKNPAFAKLLLWDDQNHDGVAQSSELSYLPRKGVTSLSVISTHDSYTDVYGNRFEYKSKVNPLGQPPNDHVDRISYDVFFVINHGISPLSKTGTLPDIVPACTY